MTTNELVFLLAGIAIGVDLALIIHFGGRHLTARRTSRELAAAQTRLAHVEAKADAAIKASGAYPPIGLEDR